MNSIIIPKGNVYSVDYNFINKNKIDRVDITEYDESRTLKEITSINYRFYNLKLADLQNNINGFDKIEALFNDTESNLIDFNNSTIDKLQCFNVRTKTTTKQTSPRTRSEVKMLLFCNIINFGDSYLGNMKKIGSGIPSGIYYDYFKQNYFVDTNFISYDSREVFANYNSSNKVYDISSNRNLQFNRVFYYDKTNYSDLPYPPTVGEDTSPMTGVITYATNTSENAYNIISNFKSSIMDNFTGPFYNPQFPYIIIMEGVSSFKAYEGDIVSDDNYRGNKHELESGEKLVLFYLPLIDTYYSLDEEGVNIIGGSSKRFFEHTITFSSFETIKTPVNYCYDYSTNESIKALVDGSNNIFSINDNELISNKNWMRFEEPFSINVRVNDELGKGIVTKYKKGLKTMNISVGNLIYYNDVGELVYNGNDGNFFKIGDIVKVPFINNLNYLVTSSELVYDGKLRINLELREVV